MSGPRSQVKTKKSNPKARYFSKKNQEEDAKNSKRENIPSSELSVPRPKSKIPYYSGTVVKAISVVSGQMKANLRCALSDTKRKLYTYVGSFQLRGLSVQSLAFALHYLKIMEGRQ